MNKKILIIPSWYPNNQNVLIGSFFKEQALLLNKNGFEVKVLFGNEKHLNLINYLKIVLKNSFKKKDKLNTNYLIQEPDAYAFNIYHYKKWPSKLKLKKNKKKYQKALKTLSKKWKPELIHAQCSANAGIYSANLSATFSIPYVIIEHQKFLIHHLKRYLQKEVMQVIKNAHKVGAVSYHQKRCILMHDIDCNPKIVWNLVDETKFQIKEQNPSLKFTITTITYPHLIKDSETFFKSLKVFNTLSNGNFEAVIIGNDAFNDIEKANSSIFKALAKKYGILDKCIFYPKLSRKEINKQLQQCNVFVSTSIAETYGVAVREAMLCGKPVIATKSGGVEDSIVKETGIIVNIKDYKAIAENLNKIKNKAIIFAPQTIRNHIIKQSGTKSFIKTMMDFYNLKDN